MRRNLLSSLAVASLLASGLAARQADALPAGPATIGGDAAPVWRVTNVCGTNGCVRVQTQRIHHQKPGSVAKNHI